MAHLTPASLFLPFLTQLTEEAWLQFKIDVEAYRLRVGDRPIRQLIHSSVLPILRLRCDAIDFGAVEDADVNTAIDGRFAPRSAVPLLTSCRRCAWARTKHGRWLR